MNIKTITDEDYGNRLFDWKPAVSEETGKYHTGYWLGDSDSLAQNGMKLETIPDEHIINDTC